MDGTSNLNASVRVSSLYLKPRLVGYHMARILKYNSVTINNTVVTGTGRDVNEISCPLCLGARIGVTQLKRIDTTSNHRKTTVRVCSSARYKIVAADDLAHIRYVNRTTATCVKGPIRIIARLKVYIGRANRGLRCGPDREY
jgi:hypothetical protein